VILVAGVFAFAPSLRAADHPTAGELLSALQKSVEKLDRARVEWTDTVQDAKYGADGKFSRTLDGTLLRDRSRWKIDRVFRWSRAVNGVRSEEKYSHQTLFGCDVIQPHEVIETKLTGPIGNDPNVYLYLHAFLDDHDNRVWDRMGLVRVLFGRMAGDGGVPLWTVMGEDTTLELLPETEVVSGVETIVLKSRGRYGEHKVWLDPARGGLPRRIEYHKQNGDLYDDEQLGSRPQATEPGKDFPPVREITAKIDNIQVEDHNGIFVISAFDEDFRMQHGGQWESGRPETFRLRSIDVDPPPFPEGTFQFDAKIPRDQIIWTLRGLPLQFHSASGKPEYEWNDGRPRRRDGT
jgi:hypothetical protein